MQPANRPTIQRIPLEKIWPATHLSRQQFGNHKLETLAHFMSGFGLLNPIRVLPVEDHYEVISGNRRWRAAKLLGWRTIDAQIETLESLLPRRRLTDWDPVTGEAA